MAEQWLSIVEYARTYHLSDMTVRRRIKNGKLHAVLKEGKYFIPAPLGDQRVQAARVDNEDQSSRTLHGAERPATSRTDAMTVVKGHPDAASTISRASTPRFAGLQQTAPAVEASPVGIPRTMVSPVAPEIQAAPFDGGSGILPSSLTRSLSQSDASWIDTKALLAYCDASLRKIGESERRTVERFKAKLETVEATLAARDFEIKSLRQQVEDLQLLVKILERKT